MQNVNGRRMCQKAVREGFNSRCKSSLEIFVQLGMQIIADEGIVISGRHGHFEHLRRWE